MTSIEFAATVTAAIAGSEEAVEALIRIAVGSGFMARKARCELRKLGVEVEEGHDFITVTPPEQLKHAEIDTYNDHRIAMCFSLVALSDTAVTINDPGCTSKTFPDYFAKLASISQA